MGDNNCYQPYGSLIGESLLLINNVKHLRRVSDSKCFSVQIDNSTDLLYVFTKQSGMESVGVA